MRTDLSRRTSGSLAARLRGVAPVLAPPLVAAVVGNGFVGRSSLRWFSQLRRPAMQVPLPVFMVVGGVYYVLMGLVLHRARLNQDTVLRDRTYLVLAGNELWNACLFGSRNTGAGFVAMIAFVPPVLSCSSARTATPGHVRRSASTRPGCWLTTCPGPTGSGASTGG